MNQSTVLLKDLYSLSAEQKMQMIFSSGDYFPGFYRYTLGTQRVGEESLGLNTLIWLFLEQKMTGNTHSKEDWLDLQHEIHDRDVASDTARNARNFPEVREMFAQKMMDWYFNASGFDIAYLDIETKVVEFEKNKTYYFMGSLIRQTETDLLISYNNLTAQSAMSIPVSFKETHAYITREFSSDQLRDLFLESEIIATLRFQNDEGQLEMNEKEIDALMLRHSETKVFGSPIESRYLPMRYAKSIRLTNFRRGEDGKFHTWQTDQNW